MRKIMLAAVMFLAVAVKAQSINTNPLWSTNLGHNYSLTLPSIAQIETVNTVALRDYYNGQWLVGYGHEFFYLYRNGVETAFLDGWNVFNTDDGKGVFGVSLGIHPLAGAYAFADSIVASVNGAGYSLPSWASKVNNFESIEVGAGDRVFGGGGPGVKRFAAIVGGEINIPFSSLFGKSGSL
jgi:hypothetical protein